MRKRAFEPRQRQHKLAAPDNARTLVIDAMNRAWRDGRTFTLHATTDGQVEVISERKRIFTFDDMGQCMDVLFPDFKQ